MGGERAAQGRHALLGRDRQAELAEEAGDRLEVRDGHGADGHPGHGRHRATPDRQQLKAEPGLPEAERRVEALRGDVVGPDLEHDRIALRSRHSAIARASRARAIPRPRAAGRTKRSESHPWKRVSAEAPPEPEQAIPAGAPSATARKGLGVERVDHRVEARAMRLRLRGGEAIHLARHGERHREVVTAEGSQLDTRGGRTASPPTGRSGPAVIAP